MGQVVVAAGLGDGGGGVEEGGDGGGGDAVLGGAGLGVGRSEGARGEGDAAQGAVHRPRPRLRPPGQLLLGPLLV